MLYKQGDDEGFASLRRQLSSPLSPSAQFEDPNPHPPHPKPTSMEAQALRRKASLYLLFVTLIWGGTFIWMKQLLSTAEANVTVWDARPAVALFIGIRFAIAFLLLALILPDSRKFGERRKQVWKGGGLLGVLMFAGFALQMVALAEITPAVSAFLTSLYVVFTALIGRSIGQQKLTKGLLIGVLLATIGAALLGLEKGDTLTDLALTEFGIPEWMTIVGAMMFALHILATDAVTKRDNPVNLSMASFIVVSACSLIMLLAIIPFSAMSFSELFGLLTLVDIWIPLLLLGGLGSFVALLILNIWQKQISPVHAAIIYSLEPVWALMYSLNQNLEVVSQWLFIGGGTLLAGNILVEFLVRKEESEDH
ncbi:MAG TPA: DMT family transporter [Candidatus Poseidoniales archaeon]|nr:DMT family transporter [Candidatus Poseidoniales archaeon]HIO94715.1 DMT family transporter [Candidatus Poseidoniales archaeon]